MRNVFVPGTVVRHQYPARKPRLQMMEPAAGGCLRELTHQHIEIRVHHASKLALVPIAWR